MAFIISQNGKILLSKLKFEPIRRLTWLAPIFLFQLFSIGLTGFLDMRYTLFFLFYIFLFLVGLAYVLLSAILKPLYVLIFSLVFLTILCFEQIIVGLPSDFLLLAQQPHSINSQLLKQSGEYQQIAALTTQSDQKPVLLIDTNQVATVSAAQFAGLSNIKTVETPSNLNDAIFVSLINTYKINYVYTNCPKWLESLQNHFVISKTNLPKLIRVEVATDSAKFNNFEYSTVRDDAYYQCKAPASVDLIK